MNYQKLDDFLFRLWMVFWTTLWVTAIAISIQYALSVFGLSRVEWEEVLIFASGVFFGGFILCGVRQWENK